MKPSLEKIIIEYLNVINEQPYKEARLYYVKERGIVFITLYVNEWKDSWDYYRTQGREYPLLERLSQEMGEVFPYDFKLTCNVLNQ